MNLKDKKKFLKLVTEDFEKVKKHLEKDDITSAVSDISKLVSKMMVGSVMVLSVEDRRDCIEQGFNLMKQFAFDLLSAYEENSDNVKWS
jgi:hypothetical protein